MRILITGGTGLLGNALRLTSLKHFEVEWTSRTQCSERSQKASLEDPKECQQLIRSVQPNVIIHTAAVGNVDQAEKNPDEVRKINVGATESIARLCQENGIRLIYLSSNAVFDGCHPLYSDEAPLSPINKYGEMKAQSGRIVLQLGDQAAIIRPILMYGWPPPGVRDNPASWWYHSLKEGKEIKVVDNVITMPLWVFDCAQAIWTLTERQLSGIFNLAGPDRLSLYEFALLAAEAFACDRAQVTPVPDTYFKTLAPRPRDTSFNIEKAKKWLDFNPLSLKEGLKIMNQTCPQK